MHVLIALLVVLFAIALNVAICAFIGCLVYYVLVWGGVAAPWPAIAGVGTALVILKK